MRTILMLAAFAATGVSLDEPEGLQFEANGRDCIALAVFTEARGEPIEGQIAVVEVIRNRMESEKWPAFPCDVVAQLDQFHGVRDWFRPRHPKDIDANAWEVALIVTDGVMLEGWRSCAADANHFFRGPRPDWAKAMQMTCAIGDHQFVAAR